MSKLERAELSRIFFSQESDNEIVYACDAAGARLIEGEKTCGLAVVIYTSDGEAMKTWAEKVTDPKATSIWGEMMALLSALELIQAHAELADSTDRFTLFTDNQFACQIATGMVNTVTPHLVEIKNKMKAIYYPLHLRGMLNVRMVPGKLNIDADLASREVIVT